MHNDREKLVERLRERLKLKYAANCKCGSCQCVPIADLHEAIAALSEPVKDEPGAVKADRAKDDQYWSVVEQRANLEDDNARLREALTEIATLNRSRDQLQEMARSVLAGLQSTAITAEPQAVPCEPAGETFAIEHDGFVGTVQGSYVTREGKPGVVLQQLGTRVVHVYGEKWLTPASSPLKEGSGDA